MAVHRGHVRWPTLASFIDTGSPEWRSKRGGGTLATLASIFTMVEVGYTPRCITYTYTSYRAI